MVERMRNLFFSEVFMEVAVVTDRKVPRLFSGGRVGGGGGRGGPRTDATEIEPITRGS